MSLNEDEVHIRAVRRALANKNAAVMVGSGFSRNAEGGGNVGTWDDLARALAKGLTPGAGESPKLNAANAIQLAEQYERLFSRPALEQLLKDVVPDERLLPGALHEALLSLDWAEVFTTNYDTLLERASEKLVDSSYVTVCCREDIPQSKVQGKRRIVKLHGSFASHRPFVVTEEDYRTYPAKFAPFINLVRQALLENVLCLIGFSGEDPNFLHWIGWVRDMLDKHALPVYLFLSEPPTLGQRSLLQARGVTPIVLPASKNGEPSDYKGRYVQLFEELSKPLEGLPEQWGKVPWLPGHSPTSTESGAEYRGFKVAIASLVSYRRIYPGWLVAPEKNRQRFENSLRSMSCWHGDKKIIEAIKGDRPIYALIALETYSWMQSVLLEEMLDPFAELGLSTLDACRELSFSRLVEGDLEILKGAGVYTQSSFEQLWGRLAASILAWSRHGPRQDQYISVTNLIKEVRRGDKLLFDHLKLNEILLHIVTGRRTEARHSLSKWRVGGEDLFMEIRRAMLVAELGEVASAFSTCEQVILSLRQQQRLKPNDPMLVSMESWACLVAAQLHRSMGQQLKSDHWDAQFLSANSLDAAEDYPGVDESSTPKLVPQAKPTDAPNRRDDKHKEYRERIDALGLRGYDSNYELAQLVSALHEESGSPVLRSRREEVGFELGSTSEIAILMGGGGPATKLNAAMAWLQLSERVGLIPRTAQLNLFVDEFLQAGWWTRKFDPLTRGIGILVRCMADEAMKPHDEAKPRHRTGWLTRSEVARLPENYVIQVSEAALTQLENFCLQLRRDKQARWTIAFFANLLGRFSIRVAKQELVLSWSSRLIALHSIKAVQESPESWPHLTKALARCMSALDPKRQLDILASVLTLPILPPGDSFMEHQRRDWLNIHLLFNAYDGDEQESISFPTDLAEHINRWVHDFVEVGRPEWERVLLANRIFVVHRLGMLAPKLEKMISHALWREYRGNEWPTLPGFLPIATLLFPGGKGISPEKELAKYITSRELRPFASGGYMRLRLPDNAAEWSLPGDRTQIDGAWELLRNNAFSNADIAKFAALAKEWLSSEAALLSRGIERHEEMRGAVIARLDALDRVLATSLIQMKGKSTKRTARARSDIADIPALASVLGAPFLRLAFLRSVEDESPAQTGLLFASLTLSLTSPHEAERTHAFHAAHWIMKTGANQSVRLAAGVLNMVCSMVASRFESVGPVALDSVAALGSAGLRRIASDESIYLLDITLERLRHRLQYGSKSEEGHVRDELIPLFRYRAVQLAFTLNGIPDIETEGADAWLNTVSEDPLPELRLARFTIERRGSVLVRSTRK